MRFTGFTPDGSRLVFRGGDRRAYALYDPATWNVSNEPKLVDPFKSFP